MIHNSMTFVGVSSLSSVIHIIAKIPKTAMLIACLGLSVFLVYHFHKDQYVKKEVNTQVTVMEKDAEKEIEMGSCMMHKCVPVGSPNVIKREELHHTGEPNAIPPVTISGVKSAVTKHGKKSVIKTNTLERP
jgi:hypothetical protein